MEETSYIPRKYVFYIALQTFSLKRRVILNFLVSGSSAVSSKRIATVHRALSKNFTPTVAENAIVQRSFRIMHVADIAIQMFAAVIVSFSQYSRQIFRASPNTIKQSFPSHFFFQKTSELGWFLIFKLLLGLCVACSFTYPYILRLCKCFVLHFRTPWHSTLPL